MQKRVLRVDIYNLFNYDGEDIERVTKLNQKLDIIALKKFLGKYMKNQRLPIKSFILLTLLAYIFSISVRTIWVYQFKDVDGFRWNGQLMINTK